MKQDGQFILFETQKELHDWLLQKVIKRKIKLIQNHHTQSPAYTDFKNDHFKRLKLMKEYHMKDNGWNDIAQNLTTFPDGSFAICRDLEADPVGIKGANAGAICIENLGNFDSGQDQMTSEHRDAIIFLNALLCKKFSLVVNTDTIVYHHWYDRDTGKRTNGDGNVKTCPGTAFFGGNSVQNALNNFIPLIQSALAKL